MLGVLTNRTYRHLFAAQAIALVGTGLTTVALGLLAYRLAGADAGAVLATALAIKMVAYILLAPLATVLTARLPRRVFLVTTDLLRATVALVLPFVTEVWQIHALVVVLQAASAAFTPVFQATIPVVLPEEADYTRALSLSRLAYELESLLSPALAAALLLLLSPTGLFWGTAVGFLASAALVLGVALPSNPLRGKQPVTTGLRRYLATPRLRALLGLNLTAAAAGAMVLVNTVVVVREDGGTDLTVALTLGTCGAGSVLAAVLLPHWLTRFGDRRLMFLGGLLVSTTLAATALGLLASGRWPVVLIAWALLGIGTAVLQTPTGRLIRRSGPAGDWPVLFAAQFTLSHTAWLLAYLVAGVVGTTAGQPAAALALAALATAGLLWSHRVWASHEDAMPHLHRDLPADDPHLHDAIPVQGGYRHSHPVLIDHNHPRWPG
ncbi:MFS family permease [Crossiella equi]|uniref:MFS family permease n=1 Tax=Crossiella equi TaxID=130796 RepID=A0ABS5A5R7_9PSEU|nr:MFS transporter [Crossiella equi]MBP2471896.1 MFS family permease [Crossiella equi]